MAFTISDFEDLVRLLGEHPEWQARLRPVILGEEILSLPSRMDRVESNLADLAETVRALSEEVRSLAAATNTRFNRVEGELGNLRGEMLELRFDRNLSKWVRPWLSRARLVDVDGLELLETARRTSVVSEADVEEVATLDAIVVGRSGGGQADSWLAVELSQTINTDDVERAHARGQILARAGYAVRSLVVGYRLSPQAGRLAESLGVLVSVRRSNTA